MEKHHFSPLWEDERKRPIGYLSANAFIPGHYETDCGGCDTITEIDHTFDLIKGYASKDWHVLFEGILAQHSAPRVVELHGMGNLVVLHLNTSLDQCFSNVDERRARTGNIRELNRAYDGALQKEYRALITSSRRLRTFGVDVRDVNCDEALDFCLKGFGYAAR
jgi:hypothetical protein